MTQLVSAPAADTAGTIEADDPTPATGRRKRRLWRTVLPPVIAFGLFIGVWYFVSYALLKPSRRFLLPPPHEVVRGGILTWSNFDQILHGLALTARAAAIGFGISIVLGVALAMLMSQAKSLERSIFPYAVVLQTIPILAIVPVLGFAFGFNFRSRVLVCVLVAVFPIITNTLFGLQSVDHGHHDLFTLHGVGRIRRLWKLQLPAALPNILTGLRISAGASVIGATVGDFFFLQGQPGLGALIDLYSSRLEPDQLYTAVIVSSLLGIFAFVLIGSISHRVIGRWHESANTNK